MRWHVFHHLQEDEILNNMIQYIVKGPVTSEMISTVVSALGDRKDCGGHSIFLGQVRDDTVDGKRVAAIEYSAYEPMVAAEAEKIRQLILKEYDDVRSLTIIHSEGVVKAGELSLFVMVSAGHRHQAAAACTKAVEIIKERLPVWKKELFDDQSHRWKENEP